MPFGRAIRDRFLLNPELAFLNNGSFGAMPRDILEVQNRLRLELEWEPVGFMFGAWLGGLREAMKPVAEFLGADADDCVFVENASSGVNAVLRSWELGPGDAILTTSHAYGAVRQALRYVCSRTGATLIEAEVPFPLSGPQDVLDAVDRAWADNVKLAVFDHISSATGLIYPVAELAERCRSRGALSVVDGAHVPGQISVELRTLGVDFWVGNLHKWLYAPKGCAVLYVAPEHRDRVHPVVISHGYGTGLAEEFDWVGTRDLTAWLAAPACVAWVESIGAEAIRHYNHDLRRDGAALIRDAWGTSAPVPDAMLGCLATLDPPCHIPADADQAAQVQRALFERHQIVVPVVPFGDRSWIRISAQIFNELDDYWRLAQAVGPDGVR